MRAVLFVDGEYAQDAAFHWAQSSKIQRGRLDYAKLIQHLQKEHELTRYHVFFEQDGAFGEAFKGFLKRLMKLGFLVHTEPVRRFEERDACSLHAQMAATILRCAMEENPVKVFVLSGNGELAPTLALLPDLGTKLVPMGFPGSVSNQLVALGQVMWLDASFLMEPSCTGPS